MQKRTVFWILAIVLLILLGLGLFFSEFFKVWFGVTGNAVKVVG